jgi:hypothetical protein
MHSFSPAHADATPLEPMAALPRFHNVVLVEEVKDPTRRLWYARRDVRGSHTRARAVREEAIR